MQPRQMRETSRPVRPSLVYFIVYPSQLRASCEVRDDIRREEFVSLDVVPVIAVDQQVHTGVLILADQIRWSITENQTKPWSSAHCALAFTASNASAGSGPY